VPLPTVTKPELMPGGDDSTFRSFIHNFLAFSARVDQCRSGFGERLGISGTAYTTLISIRHLAALGDVHVKAVADHLHLSGAFVTTVTNKLEIKGLIEKAAHPVDRRRLSLTVTARGAELLERLAPTQMQVNDVQFGCLSARDFQQLLDMVQRLVESSDRAISLQRYLAETNVQPISPGLRHPPTSKPRKARKA